MSLLNETSTTSIILDDHSPYSFTNRDLQFVLFCLLFGCALLFYLAGSPYFIGWLTKIIVKRFILNKYFIGEDYTFDIGTVSMAWLSGTIFAHKIEIRTQQFVILIVELRLSFFWWTNHIRSNNSFKDLQDENKPYRVQLKLVGLECILYANKSRFDELRNIVEQQRTKQHYSPDEREIDNNINIIMRDDNKQSPSIHTLKHSSPYSKSGGGGGKKKKDKSNTKSNSSKMDDDDDDNKTFITHSSHYTHSSQRSHQPYTYNNYYTHTSRHNRHYTAGTHTTHTTQTTDNTLSNSGETVGSNNSLEIAETQNNNNRNAKTLTIKINNDNAFMTNPNSPRGFPDTNNKETPPISAFYHKQYSEVNIIHENIDDKGTVTTEQTGSIGTTGTGHTIGYTHFGKKLKVPTTDQSTEISIDQNTQGSGGNKSQYTEEEQENKYSSDDGADQNTDPDGDGDGDEEQYPNSTIIIQIDSFSFFFQRDSPAQLKQIDNNNNLCEQTQNQIAYLLDATSNTNK